MHVLVALVTSNEQLPLGTTTSLNGVGKWSQKSAPAMFEGAKGRGQPGALLPPAPVEELLVVALPLVELLLLVAPAGSPSIERVTGLVHAATPMSAEAKGRART
jgi:hypothetical protein